VLNQFAVPVMLPQTSYISAVGVLCVGTSYAGTVSLSATSGSVTVTLSTAALAGTSADLGKQITFYDGAAYRSAFITAALTTTTATATLASTASGTGPFNTANFIGFGLPANYTTGVWVYLPAGAVVGGSAGFYFAVPFSPGSVNGMLQVTTAYQATLTTPSIPVGYSNAVGGNATYSAPTSTNLTMGSVVLPGGAMGLNGSLRASAKWSMVNNANNKPTYHFLAAQTFGANTNASTLTFGEQQTVTNRGSLSSQLNGWNGYQLSYSANPTALWTYGAINTAVNQTVSVTGSLANAADYIILEGYMLEVLPAN
jgi:hypothetical protein